MQPFGPLFKEKIFCVTVPLINKIGLQCNKVLIKYMHSWVSYNVFLTLCGGHGTFEYSCTFFLHLNFLSFQQLHLQVLGKDTVYSFHLVTAFSCPGPGDIWGVLTIILETVSIPFPPNPSRTFLYYHQSHHAISPLKLALNLQPLSSS